MPAKEPIAELLSAVDALLESRLTGEENVKAWAQLIRARRGVGEVVASDRQLLAVLEQQVSALFRPVVSEKELCSMLRCDQSWLWQQRKEGRWLHFEVDQRGRRFYTPEQILANLRGEKPKTNLKVA